MACSATHLQSGGLVATCQSAAVLLMLLLLLLMLFVGCDSVSSGDRSHDHCLAEVLSKPSSSLSCSSLFVVIDYV